MCFLSFKTVATSRNIIFFKTKIFRTKNGHPSRVRSLVPRPASCPFFHPVSIQFWTDFFLYHFQTSVNEGKPLKPHLMMSFLEVYTGWGPLSTSHGILHSHGMWMSYTGALGSPQHRLRCLWGALFSTLCTSCQPKGCIMLMAIFTVVRPELIKTFWRNHKSHGIGG